MTMTRRQYLEVEGKRFVVIEEAEFERVCRTAGEAVGEDDLPPLPEPDANGRFPALEYARASLARDLIRERRRLGLSQQRLADLAGVRQETLSRLESARHSANPRTVDKIEAAIEKHERSRSRRKRKGR